MHKDQADFLLTTAELTTLAMASCRQFGRLSVVPLDAVNDAQTRGNHELARWPEAEQETLRRMLTTLGAPSKVVTLHTTLADERLIRQVLAWPAIAQDDLTFLASSGDHWRIGTQSPFAAKGLIREMLAANDGLPIEKLSVPLPTLAIITFLAILDHLRYARRYSELVHEAAFESFTPREILARLHDAANEDFRWPLLFIEKLIPAGVLASYTEATVAAGLQALTAADLVAPLTDDAVAAPASDQLYQLLPAGETIADTVLHDVSKVAFSVSECLPGTGGPSYSGTSPGVGQDVVLLVRGGLRLMLFLLSGTDGAVAALDADALNTLLDAWFEPPDAEALAASQLPLPAPTIVRPTAAPPALAARTAPNLGTTRPVASQHPAISQYPAIDQAAMVETGVPAFAPQGVSRWGSGTCTTCGAALEANARFCNQCGQPASATPAVAPVTPESRPQPQESAAATRTGMPRTRPWTPAPQVTSGSSPSAPQASKKPSLGCYLSAAAGAVVLAILMIGIGIGLVALLRANDAGATTTPSATATVAAAAQGEPTDPPFTRAQETPDEQPVQDDTTSAAETVSAPTETPMAQEDPTETPDVAPPTAALSLTGDQYLDDTTMWDDFSSKALGWSEKTDENGGRTYVDDAYVIYDRVGMYVVSSAPVDFSPTAIDFEAMLDMGLQDGEYGVICHYQDDANWDAVAIHPIKGSYHVAQLVNDEYINMTDPLWQAAPSLDTAPRAVNQIGVECLDDEIGLFINGEFIGRWTLQVPREARGMALYVYGYRQDIEPYSVIFDNVRTWVPVQ